MTSSLGSSEPRLRTAAVRWAEIFLLVVAGVFLALHAVHLRADFPNHSPWMDWAKYTDEGWYGDAAIRHFQRGDWYVPGDFNPAAALPVWPVVESGVFRFTGVGVEPARALTVGIFALILMSVYFLIRRWQRIFDPSRQPHLAPALAVLLLAVSPFCYVFSRMAILEPMLILLTLLALIAASYLPEKSNGKGEGWSARAGALLPVVALGLLLPLMVLTKTTAIFLLPAVGWIVFARSGYSWKQTLRSGIPVVAIALSCWIAYYAVVVKPYFLDDYRYLFSANSYTGMTLSNAWEVVYEAFEDGMWAGAILYPLALGAMAVALLMRPRVLRNPLIPATILWISGYMVFISYHYNLQPRYYLVTVVPLTLVAVLVCEDLWRRRGSASPLFSTLGVAGAITLAAMVVTDARQTLDYVRHPEYTFANAADRIRQIVNSDKEHNRLVLSISGSDLSLMTGLPSICDDFGTMELEDRVKVYHPGWYVAWNQVDDDKMDALTPAYRLHRVASFPVMDDPDRNLLILYRLDPVEAVPSGPRRQVHRLPQVLRAGFGHPSGQNPLQQLQP